jgi:hypothetical protein
VQNGVERVVLGDFSYKISAVPNDEMGMLVKSYNNMVSYLEKSAKFTAGIFDKNKQAEEELKQFRNHIKYIVMERTARQNNTNAQIQAEITKLNKRIHTFREFIQANCVSMVFSTTSKNFFKTWQEDISNIFHQLRQDASARIIAEHIGQIKDEILFLNNFYSKTDNFGRFPISDFYKRLNSYLRIYEADDVFVTVNLSNEGVTYFYGYERLYIISIVLITGYMAFNMLEVKAENPAILVNIIIAGETIDVTIQDNSRMAADRAANRAANRPADEAVDGEQAAAVPKDDLLIHIFIEEISKYGINIDLSTAPRGLRYKVEIRNIGVAYENA